jgi:pimeloyl-ACP methyl ester carboxylesterase
MTTEMVELSAGPVEYTDSGGDGPPVVLLHGLLMDSSLWTGVIAGLGDDFRCVAPTLPLGAHSRPMNTDADLSPRGIARLVTEFIERLDLRDVTLVGNDTGGALVQLLMGDDNARIGRVVLASCDAFDNFPPGLTGKALVASGKLPPALFGGFMQQMRLKPVRRLPGGRAPAGLRSSRPGGLGAAGSCNAARARPQARRPAPERDAGRDPGQLYAPATGPARGFHASHQGLHQIVTRPGNLARRRGFDRIDPDCLAIFR